jgi:hypothetical protein
MKNRLVAMSAVLDDLLLDEPLRVPVSFIPPGRPSEEDAVPEESEEEETE